MQESLKKYVPAAIMPYILVNQENQGAETRRLTIMFASLGVNLSLGSTEEGRKQIQRIIVLVQQCVYRMEGSLNKLVMDDKGSTLICIWGMQPVAHEDDTTRAVLTALNMRRELSERLDCWCNIGIATGVVFAGVVGGAGNRREYSVLGDTANLAARIMAWPKMTKKGTGKIFVDIETKRGAEPFIKFEYQEHCEFKGKSVRLPIYEPLDPAEEYLHLKKNVINPFTVLKIHSNPFLIDRNNEYQMRFSRIAGKEQDLEGMKQEIIDFCNDPEDAIVILINGESGSGKTLFARALVEELKKAEVSSLPEWANREHLHIIASSLNPESQKLFLNMWQPIFKSVRPTNYLTTI